MVAWDGSVRSNKAPTSLLFADEGLEINSPKMAATKIDWIRIGPSWSVVIGIRIKFIVVKSLAELGRSQLPRALRPLTSGQRHWPSETERRPSKSPNSRVGASCGAWLGHFRSEGHRANAMSRIEVLKLPPFDSVVWFSHRSRMTAAAFAHTRS
jgi:hypothetical protein